jgi:HD-GYP domain-containing protein (c-di-GMP phosphodiesterase class II)
MNKWAFISEKCAERVNTGNAHPCPVHTTGLSKENLDEIVRNAVPPMSAVLFISCDELQLAESLLEGFVNEVLKYRLVVTVGDSSWPRKDFASIKSVMHIAGTINHPSEFRFIVNKCFNIMDEERRIERDTENYVATLLDMRHDQEDLISIGRSLSIEKDPDKLLRSILMLSKKITGADAGSIFMVEEYPDHGKQLRFKYSHTFSKNLPYEEFVMPYDKSSIAGYVAVTGKVLNIPDVYRLSRNDPVSFNSSFDKIHQYRSKSMLVIPMKNHIDEIIGVIQLINSKEPEGDARPTGNEAFEITLTKDEDFEKYVVPFASRYESLMEAVAGQAAIAIENNRMIKQIQSQFEEFVKASVTAIESRDVGTSGHSFRVADICKELAWAVNSEGEGFFKDMYFTEMAVKELELAALLHDFGKVYIDVNIFLKAKKLYPKELDNLMLKLDYLYRYTEIQFLSREAYLLGSGKKPGSLEGEKEEALKKILRIKQLIRTLNEPMVTEGDPEAIMGEIQSEVDSIHCRDIDGNPLVILSDGERSSLKIRRGSLNLEERREIESHVMHTYTFVSKIPWPPEYRNIPDIALKHHEKLDGTGYPSGLKGREAISVQARMMAIADIYDALCATDRPYKKAIPHEKSLQILQEEAEHGKLDRELVDLFIRHRIYEKIDKDKYRKKTI